jgi:hypothetical protein
MAWMRAALARMLMLTAWAWVATTAAGLIKVGKAAMALLVGAVREPTAAVPARGWSGGGRGPRVARGKSRKKNSVGNTPSSSIIRQYPTAPLLPPKP